MRRIGGGVRRPPICRSTASARVAFQRQRVSHIGDCRAACVSASSTACSCKNSKIAASGNECCGPNDNSTASSVAAACSSKSKLRQNFLRSPIPNARLMRAPNGA